MNVTVFSLPARLAFSISSAYCCGVRTGPTTFCGAVNVVAVGGLNVNLAPLPDGTTAWLPVIDVIGVAATGDDGDDDMVLI
jgi:hypothetical protein